VGWSPPSWPGRRFPRAPGSHEATDPGWALVGTQKCRPGPLGPPSERVNKSGAACPESLFFFKGVSILCTTGYGVYGSQESRRTPTTPPPPTEPVGATFPGDNGKNGPDGWVTARISPASGIRLPSLVPPPPPCCNPLLPPLGPFFFFWRCFPTNPPFFNLPSPPLVCPFTVPRWGRGRPGETSSV